MKKYIITLLLVALMVTIGSCRVQSQIQTQNINTVKHKPESELQVKPQPIDPDILKVQQITNWDLETSTYFVEQAKGRGVKVFDEALPIACIESGGTYRFDAIHTNKDGSTDGGLFQLNDITYKEIVKQLKAEDRNFNSWDRNNPEFNIAGGIYWIAYLKNNHNLEEHSLFTSYNRGVYGAKQYASRSGTYESKYSRKVNKIKNELLK
jgi:hypothetical protein